MDKNTEKKFIQSPMAIICYVLAALMLIYACFQAGSTVKQINEYYSSYGMTAKPSEYLAYVIQAMIEPLLHAVTIFMFGYILNTIRKMDPGNYKTAEELMAIEEAKKEAKSKKQAARSEAKADKSGATEAEDEAVRTDFEESLKAELKADAKLSGAAAGKNRKGSGDNTGKSVGTRSKTSKATTAKSNAAKSGAAKTGSRSNGSKSSKSGTSKTKQQ